jgi:light-regulated signal transduction histidine kinase (bacteriophytochrome)
MLSRFSIFSSDCMEEQIMRVPVLVWLCAKKILENHDGQIFAKSDLNSGSTFTIILPNYE